MLNEWKQKKDVINRYDRTAKTYDVQYSEEQNAKIEVALEDLRIDDEAVILDAGCGTGLLFSHIAKFARLIVGIDTSLNLLKQAKAKAKNYSNTAIVRADTDHEPFIAETFTHAFAFTLLQNIPKPAATLEEIKRITRLKEASFIVTGLRKQFTLEGFKLLITSAQLEITSLRTNDRLKDYVATCRKRL
jgi:ubiquinone/menaquinone biosynthesis C-methylase UbiE